MKTEIVSSRLESAEVVGGNIVVIGDLHISSTFSGQHKNYILECFETFEKVTEIVRKEKASAVVFLGDLSGVNERNIRDRQMLMRYIMFLKMLNELTNGHVYSVHGNHDCGDFTDFDMFVGLGLIKNPKYIDYYGKKPNGEKSHEVRFHLVNYGDESQPLAITGTESEASDVVLGHNEYYINGASNWYSSGKDVQLNELSNFCGVSLVVSGHIHLPSEEVLYTTLKDGSTIGLFYVGCPTRVADRYDDCWYFTFGYAEDSDVPGEYFTSYGAKFFGLKPASEVFYPREELVDVEGEDEMSERAYESSKLTEIVKEILEGRITSGDLFHQIDVIPGVRDEVKNLAKKYLEAATKI